MIRRLLRQIGLVHDDPEPAVFCKCCNDNIIDDVVPHESDGWVLKYVCSNCNETMYITFAHAGFGLECDEEGQLI